MQISKKQITFSEVFTLFLKFKSIFEHFKKKMTLIAYIFPKLRNAKDMLR